MFLNKKHVNAEVRYLLILGCNVCLKKRLPDLAEERYILFLDRAETGLLLDQEIILEACGGSWRIGGKVLSGQAPAFYFTKEKEKLFFLLSEKVEFLRPAERIFIKAGERIQIGSAYINPVFYEFSSLVKEVHAQIICTGQGKMVLNTAEEGVYVNEKAVKGDKGLHTGDRVDIYGLHLLILKELILCIPFCGVARAAGGRSFPAESRKTGNRDSVNCLIERNRGKEEALHTGEIELIMPEKTVLPPRQPLVLSLGPALTMTLPMLLMAQLGSHYMKEAGSGFYTMSVIMSGTAALLSVFWGLVSHGYGRYSKKRENKEREKQYLEYLRDMEKYLLECQKENRRILQLRYPSAQELAANEKDGAAVCWNRYYRQKDFLFFRLGTGEMPFQIQIKLSGEVKGVVPGKLSEKAKEQAKKFAVLPQVPVGIDLFENRQVGLVFEGKAAQEELLMPLLLQMIACHCYTEVKIACFYQDRRKTDREIAGCLKWIPHCWSPDRKTRFLAGNEKEAGEILPELTKELVKGLVQERKTVSIPWYVIIVLDKELIMGEVLYQCITESNGIYPASVIFAGGLEEIPKSCQFIITKKQRGEMVSLNCEHLSGQKLLLDVCSTVEVQKYARKIAGVRVREAKEGEGIPERVSFLELYGCSTVEELDSGYRWKKANPAKRLKAPIGCRTGGNLVSLDVHEKFHGPHGLIAGTTGSGKSELLQTYLLSMAVSYSPEDVNFFMIDYKGGGTGAIIKELPHCAGVISNLSGKQIKRAMSAIASENKRRQKRLSEFQINHIDGYTRLYREGQVEEPMPHLILVVDEFAELKKEEPEFMQEIISLAQVGRSLGVHLILATQKPAGTVDDKIWSNARFRLCLKVQDKQDSMDMLKNGDAAMLTTPGQCYIQIGNQEYYELFQTGYCGGIYQEGENQIPGTALLSNTGKRTRRKKEMNPRKEQSLIQVLTDYLIQTAKKLHYKKASQLWMPELPDAAALDDLKTGRKEEEICLRLGLFDDPERQRQGVLDYQPLIQGHLAVFGGPGTGKTTFLQTILWQLCEEYLPGQVQVLMVSMWQESFACFSNAAGCIGLLKDSRNKEIFFYHLEKIIRKRKKQLSGIGCRQFNKSGREPLPYIFLVIDNFGSFGKELSEKQEEFILKLILEGISLGIFVILTAAAAGELGSRIFGKIKMTIALEMGDRFQYGDILRQYYLPVLPKENTRGRGLCKVGENVLEFQGAVVFGEKEDYERIRLITEAGKRKTNILKEKRIPMPEKFPFLPEKIELSVLLKKCKGEKIQIPIGYCLQTGEVCAFSFEETAGFLIIGNEKTGRGTLLSCMITGFLKTGGRAVVIDEKRRLGYLEKKEEIVYLSSMEELAEWMQTDLESEKRELHETGHKTTEEWKGIFVSDMGSLCRFIYSFGEGREVKTSFWEQIARGKKKGRFFAGIYNPARDMEAAGTAFFREIAGWQSGICLGGNVAMQRAFDFDDLGYALQNKYQPPGTGYLKEGPGGRTKKLLLPVFDFGEDSQKQSDADILRKIEKESEYDIGGCTDSHAG